MPKAVSSTSISSMGKSTLEDMAGAGEIDLLVELNIMSMREAEQTTKRDARRLIRDEKNRRKKIRV